MTQKKYPSLCPHLTSPGPHPFIAKQKAVLAKKFSLKRMNDLFGYVTIAWLLVGADRVAEARAMADWLGESVAFAGDFNVWTPVSRAIALSARLARLAGGDPKPHVEKLVAHQALAVMERELFDPWVAREPKKIVDAMAEKPSQRSTLNLARGCASATFYRETCVPGIYYEDWLNKTAFDDVIERGLDGMRRWLRSR